MTSQTPAQHSSPPVPTVTSLDGEGIRSSGSGLTIQEASELLEVPASTLRSWERRYDLPLTPRTAGGHRRYTTDELNELRLMRDEIARGKRANDARISVRRLLQQDEPASGLVTEFLAAAQSMDPARVRTCLDRAYGQLGLGATIDDVMMPAMRQIGYWWETGMCDVAHEHLATEATRTWLGKIVSFAPPPRRLESILLACGPRDWHSLGLEAFGALLAEAGWRCRVLGARTPVPTLLRAVRETQPTAVVVVSHLATGRRYAIEAIRAAAGTGVEVLYAGNAFIAAPTRRRTPGTYLGDSHHDAVSNVVAHLVHQD